MASSYTPKQIRAIQWYAERENLKVIAPSARPYVYFRTAEGGTIKQNIFDIALWYDGRRAQEKRKERQEKSNN